MSHVASFPSKNIFTREKATFQEIESCTVGCEWVNVG